MNQRARIHDKNILESTEWAPTLLWLFVLWDSCTNHIKMVSLKQQLTITNTWSDCSPRTGQPQLSWQWGQPISNKREESDLWIFGASPHILTFLTPSDLTVHTGRSQGCGMELGLVFSLRASPQARSTVQKANGYLRAAGAELHGCPVPSTDRWAIMLTHPPSPHRAGAWSNLFI